MYNHNLVNFLAMNVTIVAQVIKIYILYVIDTQSS